MCGIVGMYLKTVDHKDRTIFNQLLFLSSLRGSDSTGVFTVNDRMGWSSQRLAESPQDFLRRGCVDAAVKALPGLPRIVVGHTRAATHGAISAENTHPFHIGKPEDRIVGVHNGTVNKVTRTAGRTDSEALYREIHAKGVNETLSNLYTADAYALVWTDAKARSFNIARNKLRPLFYANTADGFYFASEAGMLAWVLDRNGVKHDTIEEFTPFIHYKYNVKTGELTTSKIDQPKPVVYSSGSHGGGSYRGGLYGDTGWPDHGGYDSYRSTPLITNLYGGAVFDNLTGRYIPWGVIPNVTGTTPSDCGDSVSAGSGCGSDSLLGDKGSLPAKTVKNLIQEARGAREVKNNVVPFSPRKTTVTKESTTEDGDEGDTGKVTGLLRDSALNNVDPSQAYKAIDEGCAYCNDCVFGSDVIDYKRGTIQGVVRKDDTGSAFFVCEECFTAGHPTDLSRSLH